MEKNWLIRTKNNHILGPVSKKKVLELYHNGSLKPEDEISSGNGYWFFIKEQELIDKYLIGETVQGFNPVSEAHNTLGEMIEEAELPPENEIENTQVIDLNQMSELSAENSEEKKNLESEVAETPELPEEVYKLQEESEERSEELLVNEIEENEEEFFIDQSDLEIIELEKKRDLSDYFLFFLSFIFLAAAIYAFYHRQNILKLFIGSMAHAQTNISTNSLVKKKEFFPLKK